jgi:EAL domain-containing protein (putative c-di-GMP-specific phosphodiesterase class I)/ActR/RegA family two-component response regulator
MTSDPEEIPQDRPRADRLLVVDDDFVGRIVIAKLAAQVGFAATFAASFDEAVLCLRQFEFDCITLDLSLGGRDGVEILRMLAELGHATPVIVISGCEERILNSAVRVGRSLGLTVSEPLPKPLDTAALRRVLAEQRHHAAPIRTPGPLPAMISRTEIATALAGGEFLTHFQPKIELASGTVVGCEALARWRSPRLGWVLPDRFIPLVERFDLMPDFTAMMLRSAVLSCRNVAKRHPGFTIAVNVSGSLLSDLALPEKVDAALEEAGLRPEALTLEITESVAMADIDRACDILVRLRIKGVSVSLDDFGTGYSSLSALARMPFSELKLDRSFVRQGTDDPDMWKIVRGSIALAKAFQMKTVAEGIETTRVLRMLEEVDCDIGQGLVFSAAISADELDHWLDARNERAVATQLSQQTRRTPAR